MTTQTPTATSDPTARRHRLSWRHLVRSEWIKLVSTRSAVLTLAGAAVLMVAIGSIAAATATGAVDNPSGGGPGLDSSDPFGTIMAGSTLAVLVLGVLGVIVGAREYSSGLIRTTITAVPARWPVIVSKIVCFVSLSLPLLLVGTVGAFAIGSRILASGDGATIDWGDPGVVRALLGTAAYLVATGVMGIALGFVARSVGSGIGFLVALVLVVPGVATLLLGDSLSGLTSYLPSEAGASFTTVVVDADRLPALGGAAVFAAWVVGLSALAVVRLLRRDV